MRKYGGTLILLMVICFMATLPVLAQQTAVYSDPAANFRQGIELFQSQKYGAAQEKFKQAIIDFKSAPTGDTHLLLLESYYYEALTSKLLGRPDAEKLFLDLIAAAEENSTIRLAYFHLAGLYFDKKKYDKSVSWFRKVDPADLEPVEVAEYQFKYGFCLFYKKDFEKAGELFDESRKTKGMYYYPSNYYYGFIKYKEASYRETLSAFKEIENSAMYRPVVPYYIASIYFNEKKYDQLISYATGITVDGELQYRLELQQLIGKAYFEKQQYEKAMPYFEVYKSGTSKLTKSDIYQIAYCEYKTKNYSAAIEDFKELNVLNDSLGQSALYLLGDCYLKTNEKSNARLAFEAASRMDHDAFVKENSAYQFAKLSYELNYHDVTIIALQDFIRSYPQSSFLAEAKEYLSLEFLGTQNYKEALDVLRTMDSRNAAVRKAYQKVAYSRAAELYNKREPEQAIAVFDESLKNPVDVSLKVAAYFWKGMSAYDLQQYAVAISALNQFKELLLPDIILPEQVSVTLADYTIAYSYLKQSQYSEALLHFQKVLKVPLKSGNTDLRNVYADAKLRSADCGFVLKNYEMALSAYDDVIASAWPGTDYALYQKAVILGLQNKLKLKKELLSRLINEFPSSIYKDDALYETGIADLAIPAYQDAALVFKQIIEKYPKSNYVPKSHLKLGLIYFNLNQDEQAMTEYQWVINNYPKTPEGTEALNGVKEIFTEQGKAQEYLDYVRGNTNISVSDGTKDSVMYLAAENRYAKNDAAQAAREFTSYLNAFPSGQFALNAHFYRAECLFRLNEYESALVDYDYVTRQPVSRFTEKSLLHAARISYTHQKDYGKAFSYYQKLREYAEIKSNSLEAAKGMMYSAYYLKQYDDAITGAKLVMSTDVAKPGDLLEAHYYLARIYDSQGDLTGAFAEYSKVSKDNSLIGAESGYRMAEIYFEQQNLKAAEEQCYVLLKEKSGFDYWIAKTYLLIAAVFEKERDYFQAKSTLQSVIDNYKGADEIVANAKSKLIEVQQAEAENSKLKPDSQDDVMDLDSIPR